MSKLAILGGPKSVSEGMVKDWPPITDLDRRYVMESLEGSNHAFGPNCSAFEEEFAAWNGSRFAITTNSGTAALHMAVAACGCGAGDHVLVPAYSWSSTATCVLHHNCLPVFVDIDFETMNMDVERIERAITPRTKAIIVVHLHGLAANMERVMAIARKHGLKVIEDACQAHGAEFHGAKTGTLGDCAAFSFNQNKCLCSGEGGMFVTNDEQLAAAARQVWSFGETSTPVESRDYHAYALGWMYRNNDLTAAFGRAQLTQMDRYLELQREHAALLLQELQGLPALILPVEPEGHRHNWYNFVGRIDPAAVGYTGRPVGLRDAVLEALRAEGVPALVWQHFILPAMTVFQAQNAYGQGCPWSCPHTTPVQYDALQYPAAQRHCDTHFCLTNPLRAPNDASVVHAVAAGIRKVFEQLDQLPALSAGA
jgi:perosamine synthetase